MGNLFESLCRCQDLHTDCLNSALIGCNLSITYYLLGRHLAYVVICTAVINPLFVAIASSPFSLMEVGVDSRSNSAIGVGAFGCRRNSARCRISGRMAPTKCGAGPSASCLPRCGVFGYTSIWWLTAGAASSWLGMWVRWRRLTSGLIWCSWYVSGSATAAPAALAVNSAKAADTSCQ